MGKGGWGVLGARSILCSYFSHLAVGVRTSQYQQSKALLPRYKLSCPVFGQLNRFPVIRTENSQTVDFPDKPKSANLSSGQQLIGPQYHYKPPSFRYNTFGPKATTFFFGFFTPQKFDRKGVLRLPHRLSCVSEVAYCVSCVTVGVQATRRRSGPLEVVRRWCASSMFVVTRCVVERWDVVSVEQWLMALLMRPRKVLLWIYSLSLRVHLM